MVRLNAAVVGLGASKWIHCTPIKELEELYNLEIVCDIDEKKVEQFKKEFQCKGVKDVDAVLKDESIDLVVIATPCKFHKELTVSALRTGKNVLVEKPIATSVEEAKDMIEEAKKVDKILTVYHEKRLYPDHKTIQRIIKEGRLGKIISIRTGVPYSPDTFVNEKRWPKIETGADFDSSFILSQTYDYLAHHVDDMLTIVGRPVKEVYCRSGAYPGLLLPTNWEILLNFEDGPLAMIETAYTFFDYAEYPKWQIFGTNGTLKMDFANALGKTLIKYRGKDGTIGEEMIGPEDVKSGEPFREYYKKLYDTIVNGKELFVKAEEAKNAIKVLWLALESSKNGKIIPWER